jgi:hypothetical protein
MAAIPVYNPLNAIGQGLRIPEGGAGDLGVAARHASAQLRVGGDAVAGTVETYGQHEVQQENADIETAKAGTLDPLTQGINKALANAPQGKEHDALNEYLNGQGAELINKIGADASTTEGQQRAASARAELTSYAFRFGHSGVSIISAVNVRNSVNNGANVYAQQAGQGFMSLADARENTRTLVESSIKSAPDISAEDAARVRDAVLSSKYHDIDAAVGKGWAERDPVRLGEAIAKGELPNLSGEEVDALKDHAVTYNRAQVDFAQSQQKKQADDLLAQSYSGLSLDGNGNMILTPQFIQGRDQYAHMPGAEAAKTESSLKLVQQVQRDQIDGKSVVTDPRVYADLTKRLFLPSGDPHALSFADIDEARIHGALSDRDWKMMHESLEDLEKDPVKKDAYGQFSKQTEALKGVITKTNPIAGIFDAGGDQRYAEFLVAAHSRFDAAYKSGQWHKLLDANELGKLAVQYGNLPPQSGSPTLGKPQYVPPPANSPHAPTTKRNPGETAEAYLARVGAH